MVPVIHIFSFFIRWQMPGGRLWKGIHSKSSSQDTQSYPHRRTPLSMFSLGLWANIFNFE